MSAYAALSHPWWVPVLWIVIVGHISNICNTLYLHRSVTHGGVEFHPVVTHLMRFWLWLTSGIVTKEWVAVHRKHHAFADREGDPHSPAVEGLAPILFTGLFFYQRASRDPETLEKYGRGTPEDWVERNVYTRHRSRGLLLVLALDVFLFGWAVGLVVWSSMAIWVPIMGNVINGLGHALGYRNFGTRDHSHNLYPWGIWILGEELHNNHHADPRSAKFRAHWWEFDIGWMYIRLLQLFGLARVVYARSVSAREFAGRYYRDRVAGPVSDRLDRAVARVQRARDEALARMDRARDESRVRLESVRSGGRARLESAREECLAGIERVWEEGCARLDQVKSDGLDRIDGLKADARAELDRARQAARERVLRAFQTFLPESAES